MEYIITFLEGLAAFISPCCLPLLPVYVSLFAAGETASRRRTLANAACFVLGFTAVFAAMGAFAGAVGGFLNRYSAALNIVTGGIVIFFGLVFLGIIRLRFPKKADCPEKRPPARLSPPSAALFGVVYAAGWTPCSGVFLVGALMLASNRGEIVAGILMLVLYSLGLGLPFIVGALLINRLKTSFAAIRRNYRVINAVSGGLLVTMGVLMVTGLMEHYMALFSFGGDSAVPGMRNIAACFFFGTVV